MWVNLHGLKAHANGRNKCQQLPTLLGVVGQQCCVRLHGPTSLTSFKLYATSANKCQHCCGSMQTDAASHNIVGAQQCWVFLANNVGSVCMGLYVQSKRNSMQVNTSSFNLMQTQRKLNPTLKLVLTFIGLYNRIFVLHDFEKSGK